MNVLFSSLNKGDKRLKYADTDLLVTFDGDSRMDGFTGTGINQQPGIYMSNYLSGKVKSLEWYGEADGGDRISDIIDNAPTTTYTHPDPNKVNVLAVLIGVNSVLTDGVAATTAVNQVKTYIQGARDAGYNKVILITGYHIRLPHRLWGPGPEVWWDIVVDPANEAEWISYLDMIKADPNPTWDVHVDLREAPVIGGAPGLDWQGSPYWRDYIHLTEEGSNKRSDYIIEKGFCKLFR